LETELIPTLTDARLKFQTLVTANVLAIVEREFQTEESHLEAECAELGKALPLPAPMPERLSTLRQSVLESSRDLCDRIRRAEFDEPMRFSELAKQLRITVERKLEVANPRYLATFGSNKGQGST
jgi:hypothetical protein